MPFLTQEKSRTFVAHLLELANQREVSLRALAKKIAEDSIHPPTSGSRTGIALYHHLRRGSAGRKIRTDIAERTAKILGRSLTRLTSAVPLTHRVTPELRKPFGIPAKSGELLDQLELWIAARSTDKLAQTSKPKSKGVMAGRWWLRGVAAEDLDPIETARTVRQQWRLGEDAPISSIRSAATRAGILVIEFDSPDGVHAIAGRCGRAPFIAVASLDRLPQLDARVAIAIELGHLLCRREAGERFASVSDANEFSRALLLPDRARSYFQGRSAVSHRECVAFCQLFGVPPSLVADWLREWRGHDPGLDKFIRSLSVKDPAGEMEDTSVLFLDRATDALDRPKEGSWISLVGRSNPASTPDR